MPHTPKFLALLEELQKVAEVEDSETTCKTFKEKLLEIGWKERILNLYRIRNKLTGEFEQFIPNKEQLKFLEERTGRDVILKCRQIGFTTLSCIYAYDRAIWDRWCTGIMAHKQETVKLIFEIVKHCNDWFKKDWGHLYAPIEESNNTSRLSWEDLKSSITVAFDFQGLTLNFLHGSEVAFINGERLTNSLQAVPETGEVTLESTPNGRGGFFYDSWQDWKKQSGSSPFRGHFFPWFEHYPEIIERWIPEKNHKFTEEELELKQKFKLEDYHLVWRRYKIRESCQGSTEKFDIQYPSDDVSCFLSGDQNVFPRNVLSYQETFVTEPKHIGFLRNENKEIKLIADKKGAIKIWQLPKPDGVYGGGADPSGGYGQDPGCAIIVDYKTGEQVAELHGFFDPDLFADELYKLGHFYNRCFWCIEANNHGAAVILALKSKYPNLYKRQEFDSIIKKVTTQIGFYTTSTSKITITDNAVAACRDGNLRVRSDALLSEMSRFVNVVKKLNDGRIVTTMRREALADSHDDRVIAVCLAWEMIRSRPVSFQKEIDSPLSLEGFSIDPDTGFYTPSDNHSFYNDFVL